MSCGGEREACNKWGEGGGGGEAVVSCGPRLDQSGRSNRLVDACP